MALTEDQFLGRVVTLLGFERPFSSPLFLVVIALVALSTAACAWERSAVAWRDLRPSKFARCSAEGLVNSPQYVVAVDNRAFDADSVATAASAVLGRFRLQPRSSGDVIIGVGQPYGVAGSALFHWALVGVFVLAGFGHLARYEGYTNMSVGKTVRDVEDTYGSTLTKGVFVGDGFSGLTLRVTEIDLGLEDQGVDRGPAPLVLLSDGNRELKRQWVYPNNPLRYGSLVVHNTGVRPVFFGSIRSDDSSASEQVLLYFDFESKDPREFVLTDASGGSTTVAVAPIGGQRVAVLVGDRSTADTPTAGVGESVELSPGQRLTVDDLTYAAQLQVVDDWTVPWLYAMFVLGILGVSAAVFIPTRTVWMTIVETKEGMPAVLALNVRYRYRRNDPAFPRQLQEALTRAIGDPSATQREDSQ